MNNYYQIDTQSIFESFDDLYAFVCLQETDNNEDIESMQTNYLLVHVLDNPFDYQYEDLDGKLSALSSFVRENQRYAIFSMLDFIKSGLLDFNELIDIDVEDRILFNRLINMAGGTINDFSIIQEMRRVIETCRKQDMFYSYDFNKYER